MVATVTLGGTAQGIKVATVAHGLLMMTVAPNPRSDEECFEVIKAGIDAVTATGALAVINSADFYSKPPAIAQNLNLIAKFYKRYPEYVAKTFLTVKGGLDSYVPDSSEKNLRHSLDVINKALDGTKKVDVFILARVDPKIPIEEAIKTLVTLKNEGKFDHIGVSETKASTLRRANAVHPITTVEIEVSPWAYEEETKKVIATSEELGIAVLAYSPIGRGLLSGEIRKNSDIPEGDGRRSHPRFQDENLKKNLVLVDALNAIAKRKNITPAQLCVAWVASLGSRVLPLHGSSNLKRTLENIGGGNVELTAEEKTEIKEVLEKTEIAGERYPASHQGMCWG